MREQRVGLEDDAHIAPVRRHPRDVLAADQDAAGGRLDEARDHAQRRRLAAARGAEQRDEFAAPDLERDLVDRPRLAIGRGQRIEHQEGIARRHAHAATESISREGVRR